MGRGVLEVEVAAGATKVLRGKVDAEFEGYSTMCRTPSSAR